MMKERVEVPIPAEDLRLAGVLTADKDTHSLSDRSVCVCKQRNGKIFYLLSLKSLKSFFAVRSVSL